VTTNDENLIPSSRARGADTSDRAAERDLAEFHAAYAALTGDPASVSRLDLRYADAAYGAHEAPARRDDTPSVATAPHGPMARWAAQPRHRVILVVVPHPQALDRLLDVLPLFESDFRVQVVFTNPATGYQWAGMEPRIRGLGGLWVPWQQAKQMRFDLILAASHWGIQDLTGPVVLMPHGVSAVRSGNDPWADPVSHSLDRSALVVEGKVVPAALALAHERELANLTEACPEAASRAFMMGDPSFDRMLASQSYRQRYREALGVRDSQKLVLVSTSWGPDSLFGTNPQIFARVAAELPGEEYRVIGVVHPFLWHGHGRRQVLAWLSDARAAGLAIVEPDAWRAAAVAADLVIGDHGSTTVYAAALNTPVLLHTSALAAEQPDSATTRLAQLAASLHPDRPLQSQITRAIDDHNPQGYAPIAEWLTSRPGQAGPTLRAKVYRLLNLSEPNHAAPVTPVPPPELLAA
jgi:hypothetical protein